MPFSPWLHSEVVVHDVIVEGARVRVVERGSGPAILFLHGFPQTSACWARVFEKWTGKGRLLAADLPGFGNSEPPIDGDYSFAAQARRMAALLTALGIERAFWTGHDLGGAVAMAAALQQTAKVEKLVVVNAPFRKADLKRAYHFFVFGIPVVAHLALAVATDPIVAYALEKGAARDPWRDGEAAYYASLYATTQGRAAVHKTYANILRRMTGYPPRRAPREKAQRRQLPPTLVLWGASDPVLPAWLGEDVQASFPGSELLLIPGVGHFVPDEAPAIVATAVAAFAEKT